jgi:hypothetical protein
MGTYGVSYTASLHKFEDFQVINDLGGMKK